MTSTFCVVGSGFTGAIIARSLAELSFRVDVFESRPHIGGNCFTYRDESTNVLVHKYGPHIFHTDNLRVWEYISQFSEFHSYTNRVKAVARGSVYSLPINLHTINQVFGKTFGPRAAIDHIKMQADASIIDPQNFEEQALSMIGKDLYELFFQGYTLKQWEISPVDLPASILKRLPVRFDYNDSYFNHSIQVMPKHGYTPIFEKILDHPHINLFLNRSFKTDEAANYVHTFYSGPLDAWFNYCLGRLPYRTLDFVPFTCEGNFQGNAVINYCDKDIPYTRITEHKHFSPWEEHEMTICFKEYSRKCLDNDEPYYPVRFAGSNPLLDKYIELASQQSKVSFVGRLGTFRYMDMDVTILEALNASGQIAEAINTKTRIPAFFP